MEIIHCTLKKTKRRNESNDHSPIGKWLTRLGIVLIFALIGVVTYTLFGHQRRSLNREVLALESVQNRLNDDLKRERYRWGVMKSSTNLERTLANYGIAMQTPNERQIVFVETHHLSNVGLAQNR